MKRNPYITAAGKRLLLALREGEDEYLVTEGREVWVDSDCFSRATLHQLIRCCLISIDEFSKECPEIWVMNEEGNKVLDDPAYIPLIVRHLQSAM